MFEKEAEEYKDTYFGYADERISEVQDFEGNYIDISERIMKTFIDGAEFGYNKAKEEMQAQLAISEHDREHNDYELAEIYKQVKELEKENAELKDKLKNLERVAEVRLANWQKYEKENKELKSQIDKMKCCGNCVHYGRIFELCDYSMGDEDYDCRGRKWEITEND